MTDMPELPYTLKSSKLKILEFLGIAALCTAFSLWIATMNPIVGYLGAGYCGLFFLILAIQLLPGRSCLRLEQAGFTFSGLFQSHTVKWTEIEKFTVVHKTVGLKLSADYKGKKFHRSTALSSAGVEAALPDTYGMNAEQLAALMNSLKAQYSH
jgi:hypothetical protein